MDIVVNSEPDQNQSSKETPPSQPAGSTITPDQPTTPPAPAETNPVTPSTPSPTAGGKKKGLLIVIILVLLAAIGAGAYLLLNKDGNKSSTQQTAVVKKDIPLIVYGSVGDGAANHFYPKSFILVTESEMNYQIYEALVSWDNQKTIGPKLATSWTTPNDTTWEFKLARNIKFHSGRTMTAKDVKYSLMNLRDSEIAKEVAGTIKSVDIVDDYTVRIHTDGPDTLLLNRLSLLYIVDSQESLDHNGANGTGPYIVKPGTKPTESETQLVAFDGWHGGHQYTRALTYKVFESHADAIAALKKKTINFISDIYDTDVIKQLKPLTSYERLPGETVAFVGFNLNKKGSPLQNKKVREAFRLAVDGNLVNEKGKRENIPSNQLVPKEFPGYNPRIPTTKRNVAAAKALLKEAGYPNGVTFTTSFSEPSQTAASAELMRQLAEAGITLKADKYTDSDYSYFDNIIAGKLESWRVSVFSDLVDGMDVFQRALPAPTYTNAQVNDLLTKATKTLDAAKRLDYLQQVAQKLYDDAAVVPFGDTYTYWFHDANFVIPRDIPNGTLGASFAKVYAK